MALFLPDTVLIVYYEVWPFAELGKEVSFIEESDDCGVQEHLAVRNHPEQLQQKHPTVQVRLNCWIRFPTLLCHAEQVEKIHMAVHHHAN